MTIFSMTGDVSVAFTCIHIIVFTLVYTNIYHLSADLWSVSWENNKSRAGYVQGISCYGYLHTLKVKLKFSTYSE